MKKKGKEAISKRYLRKLDSEGSLFLIGQREPKLSAGSAALLRKLGQYCDSSDVVGVDDGKLSRSDAQYLRASGLLVLDEEIAQD
jgi:hypothetical protein